MNWSDLIVPFIMIFGAGGAFLWFSRKQDIKTIINKIINTELREKIDSYNQKNSKLQLQYDKDLNLTIEKQKEIKELVDESAKKIDKILGAEDEEAKKLIEEYRKGL